jgi:hypothetical protein
MKTDKSWINSKLSPYLKLTSRKFDVEIIELLETIRLNKFCSLLSECASNQGVKQLIQLNDSFNALSDNDKIQSEIELISAIEKSFTEIVKDGHISEGLKVFDIAEAHGSNLVQKLKKMFSPLARKHFCEWNDFGNSSKLTSHLSQLESCAHLIEQVDLLAICEHCVENLTSRKDLSVISTFLYHKACFGVTFNENLQQLISSSLRELLIKLAVESTSSVYKFSQFFKEYEKYKEVITIDDKNSIINHVKSIVEDSNLGIFSEFLLHEDFLIDTPEDFIINKIMNYIAEWKYVDFSNCFYKPDDFFAKYPELRRQVAQKGLELISKFKLSEEFDGAEKSCSYSSTESRNCSYLKNLKKFIGSGVSFEPFDNYINSRNADEQLILFDNGVIPQLPVTITKNIVDQISVSDIEAPSIRWYNPPKLKNQLYIKVLSSANNLFELLEDRLINLPLTKDNITLSVILVELLSINSSIESDEFSNKIIALSNKHPDNRMLQVVIWAVYLKRDKLVPIKDIFPYLPPYLQIKLLKWLFFEKAENRLTFNAHKLSDYLGGSNKSICFSVAIVLEYLMLREDNPEATLTHNVMLRLLQDREDHSEWVGIRHFVHDCQGRYNRKTEYDRWGKPKDRWRYYNGIATQKDGHIVILVPRNMVGANGERQEYNNKLFDSICQYITLAFSDIKVDQSYRETFFYLPEKYDLQVRSLVRMFNMRYGELHDELMEFLLDNSEHEVQNFCECRLSDKPDSTGFSFYWCGNRPCFRSPVGFHLSSDWSNYTILDFMRILGIPSDYTNKHGKKTRFGYYIILSSYLRSFAKFYEHLKCRKCEKLMKPADGVSNFATRAVTEFSCDNPNCSNFGMTVYLNHCFNKNNCDATIDSRDSKKCPNGQYICPECGACCSTQNFANRLSNLQYTGGYISPWLENFVRNDLGHWEKGIFYCYKCGMEMVDGICPNCHIGYNR